MIKKFADAWKKYGTKHDWKHVKKKPVIVKAIEMDKNFEVKTLEGVMTGRKGDFLVEGIKKECYPVKKEIFFETFEKFPEELTDEEKELYY